MGQFSWVEAGTYVSTPMKARGRLPNSHVDNRPRPEKAATQQRPGQASGQRARGGIRVQIMDSPSPEMPATIVRRSRIRFVAMVLAGLAAAMTAGLTGRWIEAPAIGWAVASLTYVLWVWVVIGRLDPAGTRSHAISEDPSRGTTDLLILAANLASLAAVAAVVVDSHRRSPDGQGVLAGGLLALSCVALSWLLVQTLFTLRYAELYYDPEKRGEEPGGISFNQERPPQYSDFAYVATSLGMTYQVSDTNLESHRIRAEALKHGLLSYLFGTLILATTINLVIGLAS